MAAILAASAIYVAAAWMMFGASERWLGSKNYATIAANLLAGSGYTSDGVHPTAQRPPVYPVILMATMGVFGKYWFAATIVLQALATAACLWLVFELAGLLWPGSPAPWLAIGLLMLHGPFMIEMISLRETVWFTLALLGVARCLLRDSHTAADGFGMGLCLVALYLLRPTGLVAALVTLPFAMVVTKSFQRSRRSSAAMFAAATLVLPWQIYTWHNFGAPGCFPSSLVGYNFYKGSSDETATVYPWIDADTLDKRLRQLVATIPVEDEHAVDLQYRRIAWAAIGRAPRAELRHMAINTLAFVSPFPIPLGQGRLVASGRGVSIRGFQLDVKALLFSPLVLVLLVSGLLGLIALFDLGGRHRQFGLWMTALLLAFLAVHAVTFVKTRYRLPLDALLAIPAGGWLAHYRPKWFRHLTPKNPARPAAPSVAVPS